jgi:hypothetical protein
MKFTIAAVVSLLLYSASTYSSVTPVNSWRMCDNCSSTLMHQCAIEAA